ncbi:L-lactate dehydrogenase [Rhodoferax sp. OV413]|uniref:L-lactate dehydrogenase n=1 Tax=Rhodoferax sp. OV413 TaxID=1855285 RepID=UPI000887A2A1|nr:L-lactate dehydrogenase [Rhodoferax sp. OV413]SDP23267.1 L-lactate dehydrogenase [Rhodoferax sp. OV413]
MHPRISIGIIGTGWVGASVAISVLQAGAAQELILFDARDGLAEGEAMDLAHGASFYPSATVRAGSLAEMLDTQAIVITAGKNGAPGQSRLDLLRDNLAILRGIALQLRGYQGIVVIVSNPIDVLVYDFTQASGLPPERVIGTGTMLDTARLRQILGQRLALDPRSIHAQVLGEHGDSEVVLWSGAEVGGVPLRSWPGWQRADEAQIALQVRRAAYEIIQRKGATNHAIGLVTAHLLHGMLRDERRVLTVTRVQTGALGLFGVALSLPAVVGAGGALQVLEPALEADERTALLRSAEVLRAAIASVDF